MKKSQLSFVRIVALVVLVVMVVSLCSCHRIAIALLENATGTTVSDVTEENKTEPQPKTDEPDENSDLYQTDAEQIIKQSDTQPTEHGSAGDDVFAISDVVRKVQDAVVQIYTSTGIYGNSSAGSGVIINAENGYVLTCNHVVAGNSTIVVELSDNTQYNAKLVGTDASNDIAIVKITPDPNRPLTEAKQGVSKNLVVGEVVVAIGNPLGTLGGSVSQGIISATERQIPFSNDDGSTTVMKLLQTDAAINSGNSGGGLFNLKGELIGIVNSKYSNTGVEGLGFAIPIDTVYPVELDLLAYGYVRGIADDGLSLFTVSDLELWYYQWNYARVGIYSSGLYVNSSQYTNALKQYDKIVSVNGEAVSTIDEYKAAVSKYKIGDTIQIQYTRGQTSGTAQITLQEYKPAGK